MPSTTTTRPGSGVSADDVRVLLDRYMAAWRAHDPETLRAIGQISTQAQVEALRSYFASVGDLEVDVTVLDLVISGNEARVRFQRRDKFSDPAGNLVVKVSPPIEKRVVRTPGGVRFAPVE